MVEDLDPALHEADHFVGGLLHFFHLEEVEGLVLLDSLSAENFELVEGSFADEFGFFEGLVVQVVAVVFLWLNVLFWLFGDVELLGD